jgi:hypothetical protein
MIPTNFDNFLFSFDFDNFDSQSFENSDIHATSCAITAATSQDTTISALQLAAI